MSLFSKTILLEMEKLKNPNSGLGQFCLHLGRQFHQLPHPNLEIDYYLPGTQKSVFGDETRFIKHSPLHKFFPYRGKHHKVWHCLHQNSAYLPLSKETKLILTIHDLNFMEKYKSIKRTIKLAGLQKKVDRADAITVISHFTEKMVRQHLKTGSKPIYVIPNGNTLEMVEDPTKPDFVQFHEFIFSLGIISKKKNFHVLLPLLEANPHLHLVIGGNNQGEYAAEIIAMAKKLKVEDRLHLPGTLKNEEKSWLYQNCKAFVFPSLTEGFGLPVIEAMSMGAPVFLSNRTSLPEVGGPEAFYWPDFDPKSMCKVFEEGMRDFDSARSERSKNWASKFSWEAAALAYLKIYEEI
jgi:glycosyltransferase involved in cell wall biosynthesis